MELNKIAQIGIKRQIDLMGRITIPIDYRKELKLDLGDSIEICLYDGFLVIKPCLKQLNQ